MEHVVNAVIQYTSPTKQGNTTLKDTLPHVGRIAIIYISTKQMQHNKLLNLLPGLSDHFYQAPILSDNISRNLFLSAFKKIYNRKTMHYLYLILWCPLSLHKDDNVFLVRAQQGSHQASNLAAVSITCSNKSLIIQLTRNLDYESQEFGIYQESENYKNLNYYLMFILKSVKSIHK